MAHDAVRASSGALASDVWGVRAAPRARAELRREIADFRRHLAQVDGVDIPTDLDQQVQAVRPLQERYLEVARRMTEVSGREQAQAVYAQVEQQAADLVARQDRVTGALDRRADELRGAARGDERTVQLQLLIRRSVAGWRAA